MEQLSHLPHRGMPAFFRPVLPAIDIDFDIIIGIVDDFLIAIGVHAGDRTAGHCCTFSIRIRFIA